MAKKGRSAAVIPRPATEELSEQERQEAMQRFWEVVERIGERNADKDPDEEMAFITEVVEEVRQEHYERAQREAQKRR